MRASSRSTGQCPRPTDEALSINYPDSMTRSFRRRSTPVWCVLGAWGMIVLSSLAKDPKNFAVQTSATVQENPPRITLNWVPDSVATSYHVSRRTADSAWQPLADLGGDVTSWSDGNVAIGTKYEYQTSKTTSLGNIGYGYVSSGVRVPFPDARGKIILIVENSIAGAIDAQLQQLSQDLTGDGWIVVRRGVWMNDSPVSVRDTIKSIYDSDRAGTTAVMLIGHVPVAYSGNIAPDGHENHRGAWPADTFYGEMDGPWTDETVNTQAAERQDNWNIPGDGKFDQSDIPSNVDLMVGRIDFYNMTCFANKTRSRSEVDLLREYFNKNHVYRYGNMAYERRALICDNFADKGKDPISGTAWRHFPAMVGANNIQEVGWDGFLPAATQNTYLWSYATGGGSYYYSMGVATSDDFATNDLKVVFAMFMGSYFGDWNNESNFLRASLGSGNVLAAAYSGFPQHLYFPMGIGEPIGYGLKITQNNLTNTTYAPWDQGQGEVNVSMLGDPTLRLYPVKPASNLNISSDAGIAHLVWLPSPDSILGYYVYRSANAEGPYTRINQSILTSTSFNDSPGNGAYFYMVRAVKLEQSPSGTFYNPSQGVFASTTVTGSVLQQPPGVPSLQAFVRSFSQIDLQWSNPGNTSGFKVERKGGANGAWSELANLGANSTGFSNDGLSASTEYYYRVRAFNDAGASGYSTEVRAVTPSAPIAQASAQFIELDENTSGSWPLKFGSEGFWLAATSPAFPASVHASLSGYQEYTWEASSSDNRAANVTNNSINRIASTWYGDEISLDITPDSSSSGKAAFYVLDWDGLGRSEKVTVRDVATGILLDMREVTGFGAGKYLVYQITGAVRITLQKQTGPNAVLNGIFLGGPSLAPISNKALTLSFRRASTSELLLQVSGDPGQNFRIDYSTDLTNWSMLNNGTLVTSSSEMPITQNARTTRMFLRAVNTP